MGTTVYLAYCRITHDSSFLINFLPIAFLLITFLLPFVTLFFSFFLIIFTSLFLLNRGVSKRFPFWGLC